MKILSVVLCEFANKQTDKRRVKQYSVCNIYILYLLAGDKYYNILRSLNYLVPVWDLKVSLKDH